LFSLELRRHCIIKQGLVSRSQAIADRGRRDFPGLPVIAVSGALGGTKGDMLPAALRLGAAGSLRKPFAVASLLGTVVEALAGRSPETVVA
jgi:hypothetical protein